MYLDGGERGGGGGGDDAGSHGHLYLRINSRDLLKEFIAEILLCTGYHATLARIRYSFLDASRRSVAAQN